MPTYRITLLSGKAWITEMEAHTAVNIFVSDRPIEFQGIPAEEDAQERTVIVRPEHVSSIEEI